MREHAEKILRIVCGLLVAVLLFQLVRAIVRNHPFVHVTIPAVPTLTPDTNAPPGARPPGGAPIPINVATNLPSAPTNAPSANGAINLHPTNLVMNVSTNHLGTNQPMVAAANSPALTNSLMPTNPPVGTNSLMTTNADKPGTNGVAVSGARKPPKRSGSSRSPMPGGGPFMPGMGMGQPLPELPPVARARIDKIVDSELLGPVIRPQPMALLGIAGDVAFLRADSGETGLVKEGDTLGDLKLLRIGINRVLIEQNGQKQELTIFSGMGGESLLTTPDNNSNETTNH